MRLGKIRLDFQRPAITRHGLIQPPQISKCRTKIGMCFSEIRRPFDRALKMRHRRSQLSQHIQRSAQIIMRLRKIRLQRQSALVACHRLVQPPHIRQHGAEIVMRIRVIGGQRDGLPETPRSFLQLSLFLQHRTEIAMRLGGTRRATARRAKSRLRRGQIPQRPERDAKLRLRIQIIRPKCDAPAITASRLRQPARILQRTAEAEMIQRHRAADRNRPPDLRNRRFADRLAGATQPPADAGYRRGAGLPPIPSGKAPRPRPARRHYGGAKRPYTWPGRRACRY